MELKAKHCIVVGLGDTGLATARWLAGKGARVTVADSRLTPPNLDNLKADLPEIELRLGAFNVDTFADADVLVTSPGVPLATPEIAAAIAHGIPVIGDVELLAQSLVGKPGKVIAITGSNGKSTVTTMVAQMCEAAGQKTVMAGNIGLPVLAALADWEARGDGVGEWPDVWVLELSSFQLETTTSLAPAAATVLNVSEDHLDRYAGMKEYAATKASVFGGVGVQVLNREDGWCRGMAREGRDVIWFGADTPRNDCEYGLVEINGDFSLRCGDAELLKACELPVAGLHNAVNALSSIALCRAAGLPLEPLLAALKSFKGLPHRVEFVAEVNGVAYYDDSKGTNVGATEAALKGMTRPVVLIAGGDGKGQDFSPLVEACERICRAVLLIGRDGPELANVLNEACSAYLPDDDDNYLPVMQLPTLEMAVTIASNLAEPGDVVLLSPACASLDMFRNYHHRAEVFIAAVKGLEQA
ncbi:UDP-N-acetylmuramoyl-L-alanine--D-glutamate ligase [Chitinibacter bivalviorum]|uniref:UDP-N-acetylmuramoylalanine--D-glutamate ligase n=1 Tax=Chitinibacter bivalviorum TaxID=2739434 RepID=A0A7H9BL83_9NEIS|nr:UDP-N-acetylmuramoyl-L-alanine--D-glutamate ligase [Chitinibacter bivalviorum]QLG89437.1 UDP-N-acetylmuramoyl-L-alanine--D-glutamate ligase [Chitinibacter bivalviorum]